MSGDTVRASRSLYRAALADAIEWEQSLIDGGGGDEHTRELLARFRKAYASLGGPPAQPVTTSVPIQDVRWSDEIKFPHQAGGEPGDAHAE